MMTFLRQDQYRIHYTKHLNPRSPSKTNIRLFIAIRMLTINLTQPLDLRISNLIWAGYKMVSFDYWNIQTINCKTRFSI